MTDWTITQGDCLDVLRALPDASVDAIVTDPPYGLVFMGRKWDHDVPSVDVWRECLRVIKPGGHLLAFAGTRTQHRMAVRIEDAGFEIRDLIAWVYGSGFPKSLDVSKAIDKAAGAEREKVRHKPRPETSGTMSGSTDSRPWIEASRERGYHEVEDPIPATEAARRWSGWGTALKPALEPITVARKPLDGTVAQNIIAHGTGALNVDGCRVGMETIKPQGGDKFPGVYGTYATCPESTHSGRWPANLIHDGSEEVVGLFPETGPSKGGHTPAKTSPTCYSKWDSGKLGANSGGLGDSGSAARFFYCAKASKADRDHGCQSIPIRAASECVDREPGSDGMESPRAGAGRTSGSRNHHPTVKPTDLMRYLVTLVTPPGGLVLDPFTGSGSTGRGARLAGMRFHGIERDPDYVAIARARIAAAHLWTPDSAAEEVDPRQGELGI